MNPPTRGAKAVTTIPPPTPPATPAATPAAVSPFFTVLVAKTPVPTPADAIGDTIVLPMKTNGARAALEYLPNLVSSSIASVKLLQ